MIIRKIELMDLDDLKRIHEKYYKDEFPFPDFFKHSLSTYIITDDDNKIITAGCVKTILEAFALTDKSFSAIIKGRALTQLLQGSLFTAGRFGYNELHAYIQDKEWLKILFKAGFKPTKGHSILVNW